MRDTHRAVLYNSLGGARRTSPEGEADPGQNPWRPGPKARRRHQPSRRSRVNLREYSKHRFLPKAYCLRGRRRQAAYKMAPQGAHLPSGAVLYNSRGRSPQPVRKAKPIPDRTLGAQGRRPGGAINPRGEAASTFGNTAKRRFLPQSPSPQVSHTAKKH